MGIRRGGLKGGESNPHPEGESSEQLRFLMAPEGNARVATNFGRSLDIYHYPRPNFGFWPFKEIASLNCFLICKNENITRSATSLHISTVAEQIPAAYLFTEETT